MTLELKRAVERLDLLKGQVRDVLAHILSGAFSRIGIVLSEESTSWLGRKVLDYLHRAK